MEATIWGSGFRSLGVLWTPPPPDCVACCRSCKCLRGGLVSWGRYVRSQAVEELSHYGKS